MCTHVRRLEKCSASARKLVDHLTAAASAMRRAVPDGFRSVFVSVSVSVSVSVTTCFTYLMFYCISAATALSQVPSHASCDASKACHSTRTKACDSPD